MTKKSCGSIFSSNKIINLSNVWEVNFVFLTKLSSRKKLAIFILAKAFPLVLLLASGIDIWSIDNFKTCLNVRMELPICKENDFTCSISNPDLF